MNSYTTPLQRGEKMSLREFALRCSKSTQLSNLLHLEGHDIKEEDIEKNSRLEELTQELTSLKEELDQLESQTVEEFKNSYRNSINKKIKSIKENVQKVKLNKRNALELLNEVGSWKPPTIDHEELKEFMISKLEDFIEFRCCLDYSKTSLNELESEKNELNEQILNIYNKKLKELKEDIKFYEELIKIENKNIEERKLWLRALEQTI